MLKIVDDTQRIIVVGTQQEQKNWIARFGKKISPQTPIQFLKAKDASIFKSKHRKTTKALVLSDPNGIFNDPKVRAKAINLGCIQRKVFENKILDAYTHDDFLITHFGQGVATVTQSLNEAA